MMKNGKEIVTKGFNKHEFLERLVFQDCHLAKIQDNSFRISPNMTLEVEVTS